MSRSRSTSLLLACCLAWGVTQVPSSALAAAPETRFESKRARSLYKSGLGKFNRGDYEEALEDLNASLEIEEQALSLYAKAQALNKLGRCSAAVPVYKKAEAMVPDESPAKPVIKDALATCAEKMAEQQPSVPPPPVVESTQTQEPEPDEQVPEDATEAVSETQRKRWYADPWAPSMIAVGGVGVGLGAWWLSEADAVDLETELYGDFEAARDRKRALQIRGGVVLGVGGVLVVAGAIRYAVLGRRNARPSERVSLGPGQIRLRF